MLRSMRPIVRPAFARIGVRNAHAISTPTLINIEARWEGLSSEEQEDIISQLAERQKGSWKELTPAERRAAWYISYGSWGPRKPVHGEGDTKKIVLGTGLAVVAGAALFATARYFGSSPSTMNKEWQEASNEILKENKANPFSGYDQVQSK